MLRFWNWVWHYNTPDYITVSVTLALFITVIGYIILCVVISFTNPLVSIALVAFPIGKLAMHIYDQYAKSMNGE